MTNHIDLLRYKSKMDPSTISFYFLLISISYQLINVTIIHKFGLT